MLPCHALTMAHVMMAYTVTLADVPGDSLGITVKHVSFLSQFLRDLVNNYFVTYQVSMEKKNATKY